MSRPAETAGAGGAFAILIARIFGVNEPDVLTAVGAAIGLVPAAVTLLLVNGGIRGVLRKLWRGGTQAPPPAA